MSSCKYLYSGCVILEDKDGSARLHADFEEREVCVVTLNGLARDVVAEMANTLFPSCPTIVWPEQLTVTDLMV